TMNGPWSPPTVLEPPTWSTRWRFTPGESGCSQPPTGEPAVSRRSALIPCPWANNPAPAKSEHRHGEASYCAGGKWRNMSSWVWHDCVKRRGPRAPDGVENDTGTKHYECGVYG